MNTSELEDMLDQDMQYAFERSMWKYNSSKNLVKNLLINLLTDDNFGELEYSIRFRADNGTQNLFYVDFQIDGEILMCVPNATMSDMFFIYNAKDKLSPLFVGGVHQVIGFLKSFGVGDE